MSDKTLVRKSARELARLIRTRAVSPLDVLDAHLDVIAALNPKLNAIVTLAADQAREDARRAEAAVMRGETLGPLHGLPIAVKDVTPTAGIRTTFASPLFKDYVPAEDAEAIRRLKAAGAIVLAKTNTPEFACGANTNNALFGADAQSLESGAEPGRLVRRLGGGAATGMVPIAQGTDFGCSIRIPAAFCGIVGIRPTPGLTPSDPLHLLWDPGQVHGPLARDAEDAALFLDAIVGFSRISPISVAPPWPSALAELERRDDIKGLRVAYVSDIAGIGVESGNRHDLPECRAPLWRSSAPTSSRSNLMPAAAGAAYQTWRGFWMVGQQYQRLRQIEQFGPNLKGNVEAGLKLNALDFAAAEHQREEMFRRFRALFERFDVLLTPAAPVKPYPGGDELPRSHQRQELRELYRLDRAGLSDHPGQPAGRDRAGRPVAGRVAHRHADRGAAVRRAANLADCASHPPGKQCRMAADRGRALTSSARVIGHGACINF